MANLVCFVYLRFISSLSNCSLVPVYLFLHHLSIRKHACLLSSSPFVYKKHADRIIGEPSFLQFLIQTKPFIVSLVYHQLSTWFLLFCLALWSSAVLFCCCVVLSRTCYELIYLKLALCMFFLKSALYMLMQRYGPVISTIPQQLSRFQFNMVSS